MPRSKARQALLKAAVLVASLAMSVALLEVGLLVYAQPYLAVTNKELADWERYLLELAEVNYPGWPAYVRRAYPQYRAAVEADAAAEGYRYADADPAIEDEPESVFVDDFHFGDCGNRLIAEHLHGPLVPMLERRMVAREVDPGAEKGSGRESR